MNEVAAALGANIFTASPLEEKSKTSCKGETLLPHFGNNSRVRCVSQAILLEAFIVGSQSPLYFPNMFRQPKAKILTVRQLQSSLDRSTIDFGLSALLITQAVTIFAAIPLGSGRSSAHILLDACHLIYALICMLTLTRHRMLQASLFGSLIFIIFGHILIRNTFAGLYLNAIDSHEAIALTAFVFTIGVTMIVVRHVFGPGRVTAHRIQGAVLVYLNISALFTISYSVILSYEPGAIVLATGAAIQQAPGVQASALSYFSLSTLTTAGYGDIVPVQPFVRGLANLEAVIGQLFPATLLARIVALHIAHSN